LQRAAAEPQGKAVGKEAFTMNGIFWAEVRGGSVGDGDAAWARLQPARDAALEAQSEQKQLDQEMAKLAVGGAGAATAKPAMDGGK
jgi:hypothetical protein